MHKFILGTIMSLLAVNAAPAFAQSQPFQGLFGSRAGSTPRQSLDLATSLFGAEDTNLPRLVTRGTDGERARPDVRYSDLHTRLWYTKRGERTSFAANGSSAVQYYPQLARSLRWTGAGAVALTRTTGRSRLGVSQQLRYSPYTHFRVIPIPAAPAAGLADVSAPDVALGLSGNESYRHDSSLSMGFQLSRRTAIDASFRHEYLDFIRDDQLDWRTQDSSLTASYSMTSTTALVVGYGYHRRDQGRGLPLHRHDVNIGINHDRALPFSPRTTLSFALGSTALSRHRTTEAVSNEALYLRLIGNANLEHQLSRNWNAGVFYNRWVQYVEGVSDVFLAHSVTGNLQGYLGPRVELRATSGFSTGPLRYGLRQRGYDTSASTARARVAISSVLAAQAEYVYYRYVFSDVVVLPTGIPTRANRHVFRVGLTTWFPLFNR